MVVEESRWWKPRDMVIPRSKRVVRINSRLIKDSSNIEKVEWIASERMMVVHFTNGGVYAYEGVSYQRAVALAYAPSAGSYFARKIKSKYRFEKII